MITQILETCKQTDSVNFITRKVSWQAAEPFKTTVRCPPSAVLVEKTRSSQICENIKYHFPFF